MFNVRIKKSPSNKHTGDQDDYSLVRNLAALQSNTTEASVNDKLGAVPRSQATLEAEGGESVFGDVNRDGNMELMHFVGKKHTQGGVPADIPEGSFIFSDTKSLTIKDKEVIEKIFGLPFRKQGYTPAEISKKFDINQYIQILKSETEDELSKRTAAEMLRANKDKLGILAFIQESMKGFPDGIPTIAEEVMAKIGVDPEQLIQESQPQPQEGGAPGEGVSPEDQQMMMAMMQEQGAPMEGDMPMQQYGGLTKMKKGGNNVYQSLELQKSGYNADPLVNNQVQTKVPGVNMDPFIYNANNRNVYDSLRKNPVQGFENSGFEQGKIYTFKSRPGTYYKIGNDGRLHVKNEGTGWQYKPMDDPEGKRRQVLEAGFESGLTKEFVKSKAQAKTSKFQLPGFDDKEEFNDFLQSGAIEKVVGERYKQVLDSRDPKKILDLADELENNNYDVENSWGWMPWSNQDKVQDLSDMLREEASKILDKKQRDKFLNNDAANVSTKLKTVIKDLEVKSAQNKNADLNTRLKVEKELENAKKYLTYVQSEKYKGYIKNIKTELPQTNPGLFPDWKGDFAGANAYGYEVEPGVNIGDILNFANEKYNKIKNINKGTFTPTNLLGDETSLQPIAPISSLMTVLSGYDLEDVDFGKVGVEGISAGNVPKGASNQTVLNGVVYTLTPNKDLGHYTYNATDENNAQFPITDPNLYAQLNDIFTTQYGKPIKATPPPTFESQNSSNEVVENEGVEIQAEPSVKEQLRNAPQVQRKPISTPVQSQVAPANYTPPSKYEGGLSDEDFNNLFKQFGGEIDEYEEGGIVDSFGHTIKLPQHVLKQYDPGGPVKSAVTEGTLGTKKVKTWTETYGTGDKSTVVEVVADENGNIISRRNKTTNMPVRSNEKIHRSVYEPVTEQNLTQDEKDVIAKNWKGDTKEYLDYQNMRNKFLLDNNLKTKMWEQFDQDRKDANLGMYTGSDKNSRLKSYNRKVRKEWDPKTKKYIYRTVGYDVEHMSQDDLMQELLNQEERNRRLKVYGLGDVKDQAVHGDVDFDRNDKHKGFINRSAYDIIQANPDAFSDVDFSKGHMSQAAYIGYQRALQNNPTLFPDYAAEQTGQGDETVFGLKGKISGSEGASTDTTLKEFMGYKGKPDAIPGKTTTTTEEPKGKWFCVDGQVFQSFDPNVQGTGYATQEDAKANCNVKTLEKQIPQDEYDGWFMPDIVNYATAMGQRTPFTPPALRQMQTPPSGYDLTNPIQKIAADQSNAKQISDQLFNTMDANTAAATMMGNRSLENLNAGITQTEAGNLKDVNQNYQTIGQRAMQADQVNTQLRGKYDSEMATAIEEKADQSNDKDAQLAKLFGAGWWNAARDTGNRVMYPQAKHINRISGKYDGFGGGRDPLADDTYYSPVSGKNGGVDVAATAAAEYKRVKEQLIAGGTDPKEAAEQAELASKNVYEDYRFNRNKKTGQQNYSSNVNTFGTQKFGGSIGYGAQAPDYDFGF